MTDSTKTGGPSAAQPEVRTRNRSSDPAARAVGRCRAAWQTTYDTYMHEHSTDNEDRITRGFNRFEAKKEAAAAYRDAMPSFSSRESIQGFIACVAYGVIFKAFSESLSSKLLYAAQVAIGALPREPKPSGRPQKKASKKIPPTPSPLLKAPVSDENIPN
jgi:hypothetical protein